MALNFALSFQLTFIPYKYQYGITSTYLKSIEMWAALTLGGNGSEWLELYWTETDKYLHPSTSSYQGNPNKSLNSQSTRFWASVKNHHLSKTFQRWSRQRWRRLRKIISCFSTIWSLTRRSKVQMFSILVQAASKHLIGDYFALLRLLWMAFTLYKQCHY